MIQIQRERGLWVSLVAFLIQAFTIAADSFSPWGSPNPWRDANRMLASARIA